MHANIRYTLLSLLLVFLSYGRVRAQQPITLNEAITIGLENNYGIRLDKKEVGIAKQLNSWGNAGAYPSINLGLDFNNSLNIQGSEQNQTGLVQPNIRVNWLLFDGFAVRIRKDRLALLEEFSEGNAAMVVENTIQAIVLAYYKIVLEHERLNVLEEVMNLSKDRYDYIQNRLDLGAGSTYEALQAKNAWLTDKSFYLNQAMIYRGTVRELEYLLGQDKASGYTPADTLSPVIRSYQLNDLKEKMEVSNQTLKNQYLNQRILERNLALDKSGRYPSLNVSAGGRYSEYPNGINDLENLKAMSGSYNFYTNFALSFNLFNGNKVNRDIQISLINQEIGRIELEDMKHQLTNRLINVYDLFEVRQELAEVARENKETAALNLQISTDKYRNGVINSFNFRDVQRTYLETSLAELRALYELIASHVDLIRLTGGIITEYENLD
jgi:outer membrane protein TolC